MFRWRWGGNQGSREEDFARRERGLVDVTVGFGGGESAHLLFVTGKVMRMLLEIRPVRLGMRMVRRAQSSPPSLRLGYGGAPL